MLPGAEFWFTCPDCGVMAAIDEDQAEGRVSIQCPTSLCGFHKTLFVPVEHRIPTTQATRPEEAATWIPTPHYYKGNGS